MKVRPYSVPSQFRGSPESSERRRQTATGPAPGQPRDHGRLPRSPFGTAENTQIYEGTNQIQRVVMSRQLLK